MVEINWLGHASFQIKSKKYTIYIDPYNIREGIDSADFILITHDHYDHCSFVDIEKITTPYTIIIGNHKTLSKLREKNKKEVKVGDKVELGEELEIVCVPSYNADKSFHQKSDGNIGYIISIDNIRIYHAGDCDFIPEMKNIHCEYALLPIGGTYTMDVEDAIDAANAIDAKTFIPMHYGSIVGSSDLGEKFKKLCKKNVEVKAIYNGK